VSGNVDTPQRKGAWGDVNYPKCPVTFCHFLLLALRKKADKLFSLTQLFG
jgi:hypothetical protein